MTDHDDLTALRAEVAALRAELAAVRGDRSTEVEPLGVHPRRLSRRGLLAAAVVGGAGLVATQVTTATPAAAAPGNALVLGAVNDGEGSITTVTSATGLNSSPFAVINPDPNQNSIGLVGNLGAQTGRFTGSGYQRAAVIGESKFRTGVTGLSTNAPGVYGDSNDSIGVYATSQRYYGVLGSSFGAAGVGVGVGGTSSEGTGVYAVSSSGAAVAAETLSGTGVVASSATGTGLQSTTAGAGPAVFARSATGTGVSAQGGGSAPAVDASSASGYGVQAKGARAPLRLVPSTKVTGRPTTGTHQAGELFVDKTGVLYFCTTAGTPGIWKKVTLT